MGSSSAFQALSTHRTKETIVRRGNFSAPSPIHSSDEYDPRLSIGVFDCRIKKLLRLLCDGIVISVPSPFHSLDEYDLRLSIGLFDCRVETLLRLLCDGIVISAQSPFYSSDERNNRPTRESESISNIPRNILSLCRLTI